MNNSVAPVLEILSEAEKARIEGRRRVIDCLSPAPAAPLTRILADEVAVFTRESLRALFKNVADIVKKHVVESSITDWPFEHFWNNPTEPLHSKLLGYFINPYEHHDCGSFLLKQFLEAIAPDKIFLSDNCQVRVEVERIDLSIERVGDDGKYAIIIENKVNGAVDPDKQLQRYVDRVHSRGFKYEQIHVFYLPLNKDKNPDPLDLAAILGYGDAGNKVSYKKITFEEHVAKWLDTVLSKKREPEWPPKMRHGMHENILHYRNLISYLNKKQKELKMSTEIP